MLATEIIERITGAGGQIWLVEDRIHARLPENLRLMVELIRSRKAELVDELSRLPAMPAGVRLVRWEPKIGPVQLSRCETVTDIDSFAHSTLSQIDARLHDKNWTAGNWTLSTLIERLACVGCQVVLEDESAALQ